MGNTTTRSFHRLTILLLYLLFAHQAMCLSRITAFGLTLCERICIEIAGCQNFSFLNNDLSCDGTTSTGNYTKLFNLSRETSKLKDKCELASQFLRTKCGKHRCKITQDIVEDVPQQSHFRKERILFLPHRIRTKELYIYFPGNKTFETVSLLREDVYLGAADLSTSELLLFARDRQLKVLKLHMKRIVVIKKGLYVVDMATGDMCVYMLTGFASQRKLQVVEHFITKGLKAWRIKRIHFSVNDCSKLEYDAQNLVLYLLCGSHGQVQRIDLKSGSHTILTDGLLAENIAVDGRNRLLYYSFKSIINYVNMTDESYKEAYKLRFDIHGFGYCEGRLFISRREPDGRVLYCDKRCTFLTSFPFKSKILIA